MDQVATPSSISRAVFGAFLAYDGGPVGLIAVCLMLGNYALLGIRPSVPLLVLGFCGTLVIYQLDRVLAFSPEDRVNRPGRHRWMREHAAYVWGSVVVGIGVQLGGHLSDSL